MRQDEAERTALTVRLLRFLRDWTQRQLADAAGVDRKDIHRYESGRSVPTRQTLERLCAAAGVTPGELDPFLPVLLRLTRQTQGKNHQGKRSGPGPAESDALLRSVLRRVEAELPCALAEMEAAEMEATEMEAAEPGAGPDRDGGG